MYNYVYVCMHTCKCGATNYSRVACNEMGNSLIRTLIYMVQETEILGEKTASKMRTPIIISCTNVFPNGGRV